MQSRKQKLSGKETKESPKQRIEEGTVIINPTTGEERIFMNGEWKRYE